MLIAGVQYHPGYKASTAIYDPSGHLLKQFLLDGDAEIERAIEVGDTRYTHSPGGGDPHKRFYEKVIRVKADVAALRNLFSDVSMDVRW
jgi:hypothetical protein